MKPTITVWHRLRGGARQETYTYKFKLFGKTIIRGTVHTDKKLARDQAKSDMNMRIAGGTAFADGSFRQRHDTRPCCTIGELLDCYLRYAMVAPRTKQDNMSSLRTLLRHGRIITAAGDVRRLSTAVFTGKLMRDLQATLLERAGANKFAQDTACVSANSVRRQVRSLFTRNMLACYRQQNLVLPDLADFLGVDPLKEAPKIFHMPAPQILENLRAGAPDLKANDPNGYRIYLLALGAGLRKDEIAHARWDWIEAHPEREGLNVVHVKTTDEFRPKGRRDRLIPLEPFVHGELTALRITRVSGPDYLLDGTLTERVDKAFDRFSAWLKGQGLHRRKGAHELRKIFGSVVNDQGGLGAAQDLLGHSSPTVTKAYYVGRVHLPQVKIFGP